MKRRLKWLERFLVLMDILPDDLLRKIFFFLSSKDLCAVNQVSRKWRILSNDPTLWKTLVCACSSASKLRLCLTTRLNKYAKSLVIVPGPSVFTRNNCDILNDLGSGITKLEIRCQYLSPGKSNPWAVAQPNTFPPVNVQELTFVNMDCNTVDYSLPRYSKIHSLSIIRGSASKRF